MMISDECHLGTLGQLEREAEIQNGRRSHRKKNQGSQKLKFYISLESKFNTDHFLIKEYVSEMNCF